MAATGVQTPPRDYEPVKQAIEILYAMYKHVHALDLTDTTPSCMEADDENEASSKFGLRWFRDGWSSLPRID